MARELCFKGQDPAACKGPNRKKEKTPKTNTTTTTKADVVPSGGMHMNMNNLGGNPGDVRMQKKSSSDQLGSTQMEQGAANETYVSKQKKNRLAFKKKKAA